MYLSAIVIANLTFAHFGANPYADALICMSFIGLDLTSRDTLHDAWHNHHLKLKMLILILSGGLLSFLLNRNTGQIALASTLAFFLTSTSDTLVYTYMEKRSRLLRSNTSNVVSAAVDSFSFPLLAFGFPLLWVIVLVEFVSKVFGGYVWSLLLNKFIWGNYAKETISRL
jgi:hypothetical protein